MTIVIPNIGGRSVCVRDLVLKKPAREAPSDSSSTTAKGDKGNELKDLNTEN